ncbi:MAG: class I SAM-dependent methyltransferase [Sphingobacteriales bacterium]|nr:class I SAM-dependent methyltransferase [Sphingobacteriales bacterium]OJY87429.1 MAG: methyltransferase type 11 [Sphingobacteriales bacterium 44-15]
MKQICIILVVAMVFPACNTAQEKNKALTATDTVYTYGRKTAGGTGKYYMGREIAHMIGPGGISWLERDDRQQEENTKLAIEKMELQPTSVVADIGAGSGYYSFKIAQKVLRGKVYAVDVQPEMIAFLQKQKATLKDSVVEIVKGDSVSPHLPDHSIDLAIMVDVYHELEYPHELLQSLKKALKPNGKILLIEYRGEDPGIPIKPLHKMTAAQADKEMEANGFTLYSKGEFLPIHHFLMYEVKQ